MLDNGGDVSARNAVGGSVGGSDGALEAARAGCDRVDTLEAWEPPEGHPRV